jgi:hypothetical protein
MPTVRALLAFAALVWTSLAEAAGMPPVRGEIAGACADPWVLGRIQGRFAWAEHYNWRRGFVMQAIENPRPSGHPYAEPGLIARDYCMADAVMTNGDVRTVYYAIEHGVGFAGVGRYVDFCVLGLDPWHVHDGSCRTVR